MKTTSKITNEADKMIDVLDEIQEVNVSPFFKNKVLHAIQSEKESKETYLSWFGPQLQLASLALILCLNLSVIYYCFYEIETQQSPTDFESFVQDYNLDSSNSFTLN